MSSGYLIYTQKLALDIRKKNSSPTISKKNRVGELGKLIEAINNLQGYVVAVAEETISISAVFCESLSKLQLLGARLKNWKKR
jgi:hypothetical protein